MDCKLIKKKKLSKSYTNTRPSLSVILDPKNSPLMLVS